MMESTVDIDEASALREQARYWQNRATKLLGEVEDMHRRLEVLCEALGMQTPATVGEAVFIARLHRADDEREHAELKRAGLL